MPSTASGGKVQEYAFLRFPPAAVLVDESELAGLPASARAVFEQILVNGPMGHPELRERTGIAPRTIRFAVQRLRALGFLEAVASLQDSRTCYFYVHPRRLDPAYIQQMRETAEGAAGAERLLTRLLTPAQRPVPQHPLMARRF